MSSLWNDPDIGNKWFMLQRYYAVNWSFYEMLPHAHREPEVMYAVLGECEITCYDRMRRPHVRKMKAGEYCIIDAMVPHTLYVPRSSSCRILNLELSVVEGKGIFRTEELCRLSPAITSFFRVKRQFCFLQDKTKELLPIIMGLQSHGAHILVSPEGGVVPPNPENQLASDLYFSQLFAIAAGQAVSNNADSNGNRYVMGARRFMEDHLEQTCSVLDIADALGISEAYLQRLYKQSCGETLIETLNRLRMEKACVLLAQSKLPVIEVAVSVGFNSRQHFSHTFTKYIGCSPAKYRSLKGSHFHLPPATRL